MAENLFKPHGFYTFVLIFSVVLLSFFIAGGCNNNGNNNGGDIGDTQSLCTLQSSPCSTVTINSNSTVATCELLTGTCAVDLMDVVTQVGHGVTANTIMWLQAWAGSGGNTDKGTVGGPGGYAQTTTTVNDYSSKFMTSC